MSTISNVHNVDVYVSGKSQALTNQRLAKFSWKTPKEGENKGIKPESKCVSIPFIGSNEIKDNIDKLIPHIANYLYSVQDNIIRNALENNMKLANISDNDISISSIVQFLEAGSDSESSNRMTKESVKSWFDENIADNLALILADKLGISSVPSDEESDRIMKTIAVFGEKISSLSSGKTSFDVKTARSIKNAIEIVEDDNDVYKNRFIARLDKMIAVTEINLLDLL